MIYIVYPNIILCSIQMSVGATDLLEAVYKYRKYGSGLCK